MCGGAEDVTPDGFGCFPLKGLFYLKIISVTCEHIIFVWLKFDYLFIIIILLLRQ